MGIKPVSSMLRTFVKIKENLYAITAVIAYMFYFILTMSWAGHRQILVLPQSNQVLLTYLFDIFFLLLIHGLY